MTHQTSATSAAPSGETYIDALEIRAFDAEQRAEALEKRAQDAERQVAQIRQAHAEAAADFDRTRERLRKNQQDELSRAKQRMAVALFEVADNLERSLEAARIGGSLETLTHGVTLVQGQLARVLAELGIERYHPLGEPFDPNRHEAVSMVPVKDKALDNTVVEVLKPGYRAGDLILRAAVVQVGKAETEGTE